MTSSLIAPHGGSLILNFADGDDLNVLREQAQDFPQIVIGSRQLADLELLANGAYSPLQGFMTREDYLSVVNDMHLLNGLPWSIPITLSVNAQQAAALTEGQRIALVDDAGKLHAVMTLHEVFSYDKQLEAQKVYRTTDETHPGVQALYQQGETLFGGPVRVVELPRQTFREYRYTPAQSRDLFIQRKWKRVVGFQTRNPIHRAHEYIQKCALETVDGLYLHPLVGDTKSDDIPANIRMHCYEVLLENYYPSDRAILGVLPAAMRYAGPREAIFHAILRKNYGCSHFIVGRDHAGVGNYYGTYDAQNIFAEFDPQKLGIIPLFFDHAFYCRKCEGMASTKSCPHSSDAHVTLSGTRVRQMLQAGIAPPPEFSRPEVAKILVEAIKQPV